MNKFKMYGREGMLTMIDILYNRIRKNEFASKRWREGVLNLFKKGDNADPGNYRRISY